MNDQQRVRLIMLLSSGLLLAAGVAGWSWYNSQKAQQEAENEVMTPHVRVAKKPANVDETGLSKPAAPVASDATKPGAAPAGNPTQVGTKPPEQSSQPSQQNSQPPLTAAQRQRQQAAEAAKQAVAAKPVVAHADNAAPAATAPAAAVKPAVNVQPSAASIRPHPFVAAVAPPKIAMQVPTATPPVAAATAQAAVNAAPVAAPASPGVEPVTAYSAAEAAARKEAGRNDPMQRLANLLPWPRVLKITDASGKDAKIPPPPPGVPVKPGDKSTTYTANNKKSKVPGETLIPPPPPTAPSPNGGDLGGLDIAMLPPPPSKPTIGDKLTVLAVMDDHAIISFPSAIRVKNKWPRTITLATGEQFDSIKVVEVSPDGVTIEEDGERSMRPLATVK